MLHHPSVRHIYTHCICPHRLARHFPVLRLFGGPGLLHCKYTTIIGLQIILVTLRATTTFLRALCESEELVAQLRFLRDLDEDTRKVFHDTVFGNEILIAYVHVCHASLLPNPAAVYPTCYPVLSYRGEKTYSAGAAVMLSYYLQ